MISKHILVGFLAGFCVLLGAGTATAGQAQTGFLRAVNATRVAHHLAPLHLDTRLEAAAGYHSRELLRSNTFTHGAFTARMLRFHAVGPIVGENLAWGAGSYAAPQHVIAMWLASPEHRRNLLRPGFVRIGLGFARGTFQGSGDALVVTADFAGR
jgi:uncharacterized protein YkwD